MKDLWDCEVVIVGGGPAGATAAHALAHRGRRVVLLERQRFPRFHVGESLLPASLEVFRSLGIEERIEAAGFIEKRGALFCTDDGALESYVDFSQVPGSLPRSTYNVTRSRFDELVLAEARRVGAEVLEQSRAREVAFERGGVRLDYLDAAGRGGSLFAGVVIDASGQAGFLAKRLGLRRTEGELRSVAVHAQYEGVTRPEGRRAGDVRIVSLNDTGWIWLIPLTETVTSVGAVLPRDSARLAESGGSAQELLDGCLGEAPVVARVMAAARRLTSVRRDADYSYHPSAYAGDRWLLVGDAGSFLDPIFSTGVLLAQKAALEAAEAIDRGLEANDLSRRAFAAYDRVQRRRYRFLRRLVVGFYEPALRDLMLRPRNRFGIFDALIAVMAGDWRPTLGRQLRLRLFFTLAALQKRWPLVPRIHHTGAPGRPSPRG